MAKSRYAPRVGFLLVLSFSQSCYFVCYFLWCDIWIGVCWQPGSVVGKCSARLAEESGWATTDRRGNVVTTTGALSVIVSRRVRSISVLRRNVTPACITIARRDHPGDSEPDTGWNTSLAFNVHPILNNKLVVTFSERSRFCQAICLGWTNNWKGSTHEASADQLRQATMVMGHLWIHN